jgi:hypothetical protein
VLELELVEERVLELMRTGLPIRAHMALLDELAAGKPSSVSFGSIVEYRTDDTEKPTG